MSHWNHRVLKKVIHGETTFAIHEIYYNDDCKPVSWIEDSVPPSGYTLEDLKVSFEYQKRAFEKPLLEIVIIDGEEKLIEASMSEALE